MNEELVLHEIKTLKKGYEEHDRDIEELKQSRAVSDVKMDNLCEKLGAQTKSLNWLIGLMASALLGFFFYAIQTNLF